MLFLTVPGGTASLRRGLFMGSPGMYIRGFVKGGDIRKGRGVFGAYVELMLDHKGVVFCLCEDHNLQSENIFAK